MLLLDFFRGLCGYLYCVAFVVLGEICGFGHYGYLVFVNLWMLSVVTWLLVSCLLICCLCV